MTMQLSPVLVIDDDPILLDTLASVLRLRLPDVRIETADSALAALERIRSMDYTAIICDAHQPRIEGIGFVRAVQKVHPEWPVVLLLEKHDEDFGQTLGYYGVGPGFYFEMPIFGPSSFRDSLTRPLDSLLNPAISTFPPHQSHVVTHQVPCSICHDPQVMPLLLIAVLFRTIEALKSFDLIMGLTGGGPGDQTEVIAVSLYREAFAGQFRTGHASALAYIILIIVIAISNMYIRYLNKAKGEG